MKKFLLAAYIFFCTGGCFAQTFCAHAVHNCQCNPQQRQNTVVAELDFNKPTDLSRHMVTTRTPIIDTVRATLLVTRNNMRMAFSYEGYAVIRQVMGVLPVGTTLEICDTIYLDDRKRPIKPPITVWGMKEKEGKP
jgi:hypothetical protein